MIGDDLFCMYRQLFSIIYNTKSLCRSSLPLPCQFTHICHTLDTDFASYESASFRIDSKWPMVSYNVAIKNDWIPKIVDEDVYASDPTQEEEDDVFFMQELPVDTYDYIGWIWIELKKNGNA